MDDTANNVGNFFNPNQGKPQQQQQQRFNTTAQTPAPQQRRNQAITQRKNKQPNYFADAFNSVGKFTGDINNATYGSVQRGIGSVGKFGGDVVKNVADSINNTVVKPIANEAASGDIEDALGGLNRNRQAGILSQKDLTQQAQKLTQGGFTGRKLVVDNKGARLQSKNPLEFAGGFSQAGNAVAQILPLGGLATGAKAGLQLGGKEALKQFAKSSLLNNAKQAGVYGTAQTASDASQGTLTPLGVATNYAAPLVLGAGSEVVGRAAGAGLRGSVKAAKATNTRIEQINPQTRELDASYGNMQRMFDQTTDPKSRAAYNEAMALNRQDRAALTQGGYIAGPGAKGFKEAQTKGLVFDGVDGKPRFEVDDSGAQFGQYKTNMGRGSTIGEMLDHPEMFDNYPDLRGVKVWKKPKEGNPYKAEYTDELDSINIREDQFNPDGTLTSDGKETLIHELQHAIQKREKFASGDSLKNGRDDYFKSAGEAEARAVQARMNMPMSERYVTPKTKAGDYVGSHQAPTRGTDNYHAPASDVTGGAGMFPDDIYTDPRAYRYYGHGGDAKTIAMDKKSIELIRALKNKPDAEVTMYRAVPAGKTDQVNAGDWVTLNKDYAQMHNDSQFDGKGAILEKKVKADELYTDGNSIHEFGYDPRVTPRSTFYDSLDVPKKDLIIRNGDGVAMSVDPSKVTTKLVSRQDENIVIPGQREATLTEAKPDPVRIRGFADTVMNAEQTRTPVRTGLVEQNTGYNVRNTDDLATRAANLVKDSPQEAERIARMGNDDTAVAVGSELIKKYQNEGNYQAAIDVVQQLAPKLTEAGRTAQAASIYGRLTPEGSLRFSQRQLDKYNEAEGLIGQGGKADSKKLAKLSPEKAKQIDEAAKAVQALPEGEDKIEAIIKLTRLTHGVAPTPLLEKLTNIWRAGLLTSARTSEGGFIGNASKAVLDIPAQAVAGGIDRFITAPLMNRGVRSNVFTLKGLLSGAKEGVGRGAKYMKTGIDTRDVGRGYDLKPANYEGGGAINKIGRSSDYVYRAMGAVDNPAYYSALKRGKNEQVKIARSRGEKVTADTLSGDDLAAAENFAREAVFQNDTTLGTIASAIKNAPQRIKDPTSRKAAQAVVDFVIPFSKIPSAVATALVDYSPVGVVLQAGKQGIKKEKDLRAINNAIGKSTVGSLGGMWLGNQLYNNDLLTLEEPSDPKERELWKLQGKQKFSVKIGDKWRSLNYVQPLGGLLALGGGYQRATDEGDPNPLNTAAMTGVKSVTEQSFLQGVSNAITSVTDDQNRAAYINGLAGSTVPNFVRDLSRATDTLEREVNTPLDAIRAGIPGLRQQNLAQKDPFGKDVERKQSPIGVLADPFKSTKSKSNPVVDELTRLYKADPEDLGVVPSKLQKNQTFAGETAKLTPEQLNDFKGKVGQTAFNEIQNTLKTDEYKSLSDQDKSKAIKSIISTSRSNAKESFAANNVLKDKKDKKLALDTTKFNQSSASIGSKKSTNNKSAYEKAQKKYDKEYSTYSDVQKLKADKELTSLKVKKDFDKDVTDLYGMSKQQAYDFVSKNPDGNRIAEKLVAYGDAQVKAGTAKYNKFRLKNGAVSIAPAAKGSSSGKKGRKVGKGKKMKYDLSAYTLGLTTNKALRNILKKYK